MTDVKDIVRRLDEVSWAVAIADARRGKPQELAALIVTQPIPEHLKRDVKLVLANPVHLRRPGGRPAKRPGDGAICRMKELLRALTSDWPADEDGAAWEALSTTQAVKLLAKARKVDEKTIRNWLGSGNSAQSNRKNTRG